MKRIETDIGTVFADEDEFSGTFAYGISDDCETIHFFSATKENGEWYDDCSSWWIDVDDELKEETKPYIELIKNGELPCYDDSYMDLKCYKDFAKRNEDFNGLMKFF